MNYNKEPSLVNISNSILKHFGVDTFHDSIPEIDKALRGHKKVVLVLFDGMGKNITRLHLKEDSFIRSHFVLTINSTFPPTTAAATTSLLTGKYPIETGWLGWNTYFPELDRNIILFRGIDFNTKEVIDKDIAYKKYPNKSIIDLINEKSTAKASAIQRYPIQRKGPKSLRKGAKMIKNTLKESENSFIYFYWDSPDYEMHENGIDHKKVHKQVKKIDKFLKKITKQNKDALFILLADHGHINIKILDICDHDDLYSCLSKKVTLEKRCPSFFVKIDKRQEFESLFNKYYGEYFELYSKEEVLKNHIFGIGEPKPGVLDSFGDYLAIAKTEYSLTASKEFIRDTKRKPFIYKGHHAGGTKEEREIDVSIYNQ